MRRWLYTYRHVRGEPARLEETLTHRISELLQRATDSPDARPASDGSFPIWLDTSVAGLTAAKCVRVTTGVAVRADGRLRIPLEWYAEPARRAFPAFEGTLELEPLSPRGVQLTLVGSYELPFGIVGATVDATVLSGAAQRTATGLVDAFADALARTAHEDARPAAPGPRPPAAPLRVRDVMTCEPIVLDEDLPLRTAALLLFHYEISGAPVVARDGALVGVLSEADLLDKEAVQRAGLGRAAAAARRRRRARTVGEACTRPARVTAPDADLRAVARRMLDEGIARFPVVDSSRIAGMITRHDVLRALLRTDTDLQAAVGATLARLDEPDVTVSVEWGEAMLDGAVRRRSDVPIVVRAVEAVDGIYAVHDENLGWAEDDVTPALPIRPL